MVTKPDASKTAPHTAPVKGDAAGEEHAQDREAAQRGLFVSMALEMSWQLAAVVIVPIVGGYMADSRFHTSPWLTLVGLAFAAAGMVAVLLRIVREADRRAANIDSTRPKGRA